MNKTRYRRRWTASAGLMLMTAAMLTACMQSGPTGGLAVGQQAPQISAEGWLGGEPPENVDGKVVVVSAWAYW